MDTKQRADLVRTIRFERKQRRPRKTVNNRETQLTYNEQQARRDPQIESQRFPIAPAGANYSEAYRLRHATSRSRMEVARTRSRFHRVRRGEGADAYINRTAEGGDSSYGDAANRYDLRRPRGAAPAPTWDDGYTNYNGSGARARDRANRRRR